MDAFVIGVHRLEGISKKNNKPYDMCNIHFLKAVDQSRSPERASSGFGYTSMEMPLDPRSIMKFADVKFPCWLKLEYELQLNSFGKPESVIIGFTESAKIKTTGLAVADQKAS